MFQNIEKREANNHKGREQCCAQNKPNFVVAAYSVVFLKRFHEHEHGEEATEETAEMTPEVYPGVIDLESEVHHHNEKNED